MSWVDKYFNAGIKTLQAMGVTVAQRQTLNFASGVTLVDNPGLARTDCFVNGGILPAGGVPVYAAVNSGGSTFPLPLTGGMVFYDTTTGPLTFILPSPTPVPQSFFDFVDVGTQNVNGVLTGGLVSNPAIVQGSSGLNVFNPSGNGQGKILPSYTITTPFSSYAFANVPNWLSRAAYWANVTGTAVLMPQLTPYTAGTYNLPIGNWLIFYDTTAGTITFNLPGAILPCAFTFVDVGTTLVGTTPTNGLANFPATVVGGAYNVFCPWGAGTQDTLQPSIVLSKGTSGYWASNTVSLAPKPSTPYWAVTA